MRCGAPDPPARDSDAGGSVGEPVDPLTRSAGAVADGDAVDWNAARDDSPELTEALDGLERVERIARAWRDVAPGDAGAETAAPRPVRFRWGDLEIHARLGEGSFGEVFLARDPGLDRDVALKLRPAGGDEADARRDLEEARRLARVRHPNVLAIHGADVRDGRAGLWTERIEGRTLEQALAADGPLGAREAALIGVDLCRALAAVHAAGLVHGDVKASNVMRETGGRIVLMDFGSASRSGGGARLTGTPLAAAPEVLEGGPPTAASDLFALGTLLFRLVTGRHHVEAASVDALRRALADGTRVSLRSLRPDLPTAFVAALERALERDPARRFRDAGAMEAALAASMGAAWSATAEAGEAPAGGRGRRPVPAWRRPAGAVALAALAVALATAAWLEWTPRVPGGGDSAGTPGSGAAPVPGPRTESGAAEPGSRSATATSGTAAPPQDPAGPDPARGRFAPEATAVLWRVRDGVATPLEDGDAVRPGDHLSLEFRAAERLWVYVLDEDDRGEMFVLFPVAGVEARNPLPAGGPHRLPGPRGGEPLDWVVSSTGGRERVLAIASRRPIEALERQIAALPSADPSRPVVFPPPSEAAVAELRGIGRMAPASAMPAGASRLDRLWGELSAGGEAVWVRRVVLDNR
jgi:hypothetical protein